LYYLDQSLKDSEEIVAVKKEQDELLRKESEAREWALELLFVAKKEHDRKLAVKDRLRAAEEQARQDAATINRLRLERDESRRTTGRLRSERNVAHNECDQDS
jgi:hypothetical protein